MKNIKIIAQKFMHTRSSQGGLLDEEWREGEWYLIAGSSTLAAPCFSCIKFKARKATVVTCQARLQQTAVTHFGCQGKAYFTQRQSLKKPQELARTSGEKLG